MSNVDVHRISMKIYENDDQPVDSAWFVVASEDCFSAFLRPFGHDAVSHMDLLPGSFLAASIQWALARWEVLVAGCVGLPGASHRNLATTDTTWGCHDHRRFQEGKTEISSWEMYTWRWVAGKNRGNIPQYITIQIIQNICVCIINNYVIIYITYKYIYMYVYGYIVCIWWGNCLDVRFLNDLLLSFSLTWVDLDMLNHWLLLVVIFGLLRFNMCFLSSLAMELMNLMRKNVWRYPLANYHHNGNIAILNSYVELPEGTLAHYTQH